MGMEIRLFGGNSKHYFGTARPLIAQPAGAVRPI
jgi:hypothetical protein